MTDWMKDSTVSDVQTAIQTQTIQTALERNNSGLTDVAFTSYLQNAPIPRFYVGTISGTFSTGIVTAAWTTAGGLSGNYHDPYNMLVPTTGVFTFPIDGYYLVSFLMIGTGTAGAYVQLLLQNVGTVNYVAQILTTSSAPAATNYQNTLSIVLPWRAGNTARVQIGNGGAANLSPIVGSLSCVWCAPYNNYTTQGGN